MPFTSNFYFVVLLLWLYFFVGGLAMPLIIGVMINSVEGELKSKANAVANISYNLLGYFPAPFLYGLICERTGGQTSRGGLIFNSFMNVPSFVLLLIAALRQIAA